MLSILAFIDANDFKKRLHVRVRSYDVIFKKRHLAYMHVIQSLT